MSLRIRKAEVNDIPILEIIRRQSIESGFEKEEKYDRKEFAEIVATPDQSLEDQIKSDDFSVLIAETDMTEVGYIVYNKKNSQITGLYIAPAHQGHGGGSFLLERIEKIALELEKESLTVDVYYNSVEFFRKKGYKKMSEDEDKKNKVETIRLKKKFNHT